MRLIGAKQTWQWSSLRAEGTCDSDSVKNVTRCWECGVWYIISCRSELHDLKTNDSFTKSLEDIRNLFGNCSGVRTVGGRRSVSPWAVIWRLFLFQLFTDGTTNKLVGCYVDDSPEDVVLVRVYGNRTELIVDRDNELKSFQVGQKNKRVKWDVISCQFTVKSSCVVCHPISL